MRRELCTRAVGSAPCRPPACVLAHSPKEPPSLVPALGQLSVWTPRRGYFRRYAISERRPASGHARLNPCAGEMQSMQGVQTRIPGYAPTFSGFGPRGRRPTGTAGLPLFHRWVECARWDVRCDGRFAKDHRRLREAHTAHRRCARASLILEFVAKAKCQNAECRISLPKSRA